MNTKINDLVTRDLALSSIDTNKPTSLELSDRAVNGLLTNSLYPNKSKSLSYSNDYRSLTSYKSLTCTSSSSEKSILVKNGDLFVFETSTYIKKSLKKYSSFSFQSLTQQSITQGDVKRMNDIYVSQKQLCLPIYSSRNSQSSKNNSLLFHDGFDKNKINDYKYGLSGVVNK
jgi:hypothetical protein